jgi:hypothetical protein
MHRAKALFRSTALATLGGIGLLGIVATSEPFGQDVVGTSSAFTLTLEEGSQSVLAEADAIFQANAAALAGTGQVAVTVEFDETAQGAVAITLRSLSSGNSRTVEVFDVQSQGTLRVAMDAFDGCGASCTEQLEIEAERLGDENARIRMSCTLDGFASLDSPDDVTPSGTLRFELN